MIYSQPWTTIGIKQRKVPENSIQCMVHFLVCCMHALAKWNVNSKHISFQSYFSFSSHFLQYVMQSPRRNINEPCQDNLTLHCTILQKYLFFHKTYCFHVKLFRITRLFWLNNISFGFFGYEAVKNWRLYAGKQY